MMNRASNLEHVYVPLHIELFAELEKRLGSAAVFSAIDEVITQYLDRNDVGATGYSAEETAKAETVTDKEFFAKFGVTVLGYQWQTLFLPNGTKLRMRYKGEYFYADVVQEEIIYGEESLSPSRFASAVAEGSSRNAWRDIYVQLPGSSNWKLASSLRKTE